MLDDAFWCFAWWHLITIDNAWWLSFDVIYFGIIKLFSLILWDKNQKGERQGLIMKSTKSVGKCQILPTLRRINAVIYFSPCNTWQ